MVTDADDDDEFSVCVLRNEIMKVGMCTPQGFISLLSDSTIVGYVCSEETGRQNSS